MLHLYTGDGKGKTTAAVGLCIRALGRDFSVCFTQFMKGNDTGELHILSSLPNVTILRSEKNFGFYRAMSEADKDELTKIHNRILEDIIKLVKAEECRMVVMDELTYPVKWGLVDVEKLKYLLKLGKKEGTELVITGRDAEDFLIDAADYITEMKSLRHPYEKGIPARNGIEL